MAEARAGSDISLIRHIRTPLGAARRYLRREIARLLHPRRRRKALAELRSRPLPRRVLSQCLGNICRSPYVEAYLGEAGKEMGIQVISRGFIGPGRPPPTDALEAAAKRGVDTRQHISRLVEAEDLRNTDLVILVDPTHAPRLRNEAGPHQTPLLILGDLDPENTGFRTIEDPWGKEPQVFDEVFQRLERCMDVLLTEWESLRSD